MKTVTFKYSNTGTGTIVKMKNKIMGRIYDKGAIHKVEIPTSRIYGFSYNVETFEKALDSLRTHYEDLLSIASCQASVFIIHK